MICDLLALRPISHITKKTLSYLHSTKIEQMTKTMVIFKRGAIFLCCIRCDPIPPQTSVQRLAHTRNVTTCCSSVLLFSGPDEFETGLIDTFNGAEGLNVEWSRSERGSKVQDCGKMLRIRLTRIITLRRIILVPRALRFMVTWS